MLQFRKSAFDHKITKDQIEEVLANKWELTKWFPIHDDANGNSQDMVVGFDNEGTSIEIGLSYIDDDEVVFHADKVTTAWQTEYNKG